MTYIPQFERIGFLPCPNVMSRIDTRGYGEKVEDLLLDRAQRVGESLHELAIFGEQEMSSARAEDTKELLGGRSRRWSILGEDLDVG